ncbi:hypothetical protein MS3_00000141 [Schistosoma haematobium]|uniref:Uncharacterized protein n=1 Tax=Schistosoma haematobium TaxID=6185 RepID=A0A922S0Y2_SCHHA|nr:hypothetical protein MS3_00000141 [Schistosoma haematobium]KAH9588354.1 hypothetical protein MS3_00000141 [Schistosoma haematobium]
MHLCRTRPQIYSCICVTAKDFVQDNSKSSTFGCIISPTSTQWSTPNKIAQFNFQQLHERMLCFGLAAPGFFQLNSAPEHIVYRRRRWVGIRDTYLDRLR